MDQKVTQGIVKSLEVEADANLLALNDALSARGIDAGRILSVHFLPGNRIANGAKDRYRLLYLS
ncbi:MAG: hypothetical protein ACXWJN_07315 [Methyloceanibacter sp.]